MTPFALLARAIRNRHHPFVHVGFWMLVMCGGVWLIFDGYETIASPHWPLTNGYVESVYQSRSRRSLSTVTVKYRYWVADQEFSGFAYDSEIPLPVSWAFGSAPSGSLLERAEREYPPGKRIRVHYRPSSLSDSRLEGVGKRAALFPIALGLVVLAWSGVKVISALRARPQSSSTGPPLGTRRPGTLSEAMSEFWHEWMDTAPGARTSWGDAQPFTGFSLLAVLACSLLVAPGALMIWAALQVYGKTGEPMTDRLLLGMGLAALALGLFPIARIAWLAFRDYQTRRSQS